MMADGSLFSRLIDRFLGAEIQRRVGLAVRALDDSRDRLLSRPKDTYPRDRHGYDRDELLADALEAWRVNPLARRVVELTSQYVVGGGLSVESPHERTDRFLGEWWNHRLNRMDTRCFELCDELSRSGNLFIVLSTDAGGMSYVRCLPAADVLDIETAPNDVEQALWVIEKPDMTLTPNPSPEGRGGTLTPGPSPEGRGGTLLEGRRWKVYDERNDSLSENGEFEPVVLHYAVNRPVGAKWGESDLGPILRWLSRYASWLEDRARLNRYRNTFLFWVKAKFDSNAARLQRQAELNANPPNPGSILVTDDTETWTVLNSNLASFEAGEDGLALKKMLAAGSGNPLHFLAEPESSTRTTAESAGGPTFRHYEQRQLYFLWLIEDLARVVVARRAMVDRHVSRKAEIKVKGSDISARDNASLAVAASTILGAFLALREHGLIDDAELLRLAYRFAGEVVDVEAMLERGEKAKPWTTNDTNKTNGDEPKKQKGMQPGRPPGVEVDPITGETKIPGENE